MIDTRAVGAYISQLRRDADLTQAEMANRLNVTHQAVSKWENGLALPDVQTLMDLSVLFGVSIEQILGGHERTSVGRAGVQQLSRSEAVQQQAQEESSPESVKHESLQTAAGSGGPGPISHPEPQEPDEPGALKQGQVELDLDLLSELAPFMGTEAVDRAFERACAGEIGPDDLAHLAPFLGADLVEELVFGKAERD